MSIVRQRSGLGGGLLELLWDVLVLAVVVVHVVLAPYTKVEESFNMQATHDVLIHGTDFGSYDHHQFPGAVPRTFLGAFATAAAAAPAAVGARWLGASPITSLYAVRFALGVGSVAAHARLRFAVATEWGKVAARSFATITALQFHLPFYMSRTLPNTFALIWVNLAHAEALAGSGYRCLAILAAAAAVHRCDLLVLIAPMGLMLLAQRRVTFLRAAVVTAAAAALAAATSIAVDSVMWGRRLWPEFEVLWFNTAENKSNEWGTSPPLWYFYSALPRALLGALPLTALGFACERRARPFAAVAFAFVVLYSFLAHKELRFIFPAIPIFNACAAAGVAWCFRTKGALRFFAAVGLAGIAVGTSLVTCVMSAASAANYPGGVALVGLQEAEPPSPPLSVHIGNLAATSGVSRFLELRGEWRYSKEEKLQPIELWGRGFDRLLAEWPEVPGYRCQAAVHGFERLAIQRAALPLAIKKRPQVYVLSRNAEGATMPCGADAPVWR